MKKLILFIFVFCLLLNNCCFAAEQNFGFEYDSIEQIDSAHIIITQNGKKGLIEFSSLVYEEDKNGLQIIRNAGSYALINHNKSELASEGEMIIPINYDDIQEGDQYNTFILTKNNKKGFQWFDKIIFPVVYDDIYFDTEHEHYILLKDGKKDVFKLETEITDFKIEIMPLESNKQNEL